MLLKNRKKKLMRILSIASLVLIMIGIAIPQSVFAIKNSVTHTELQRGDILFPGDEVNIMGGYE